MLIRLIGDRYRRFHAVERQADSSKTCLYETLGAMLIEQKTIALKADDTTRRQLRAGKSNNLLQIGMQERFANTVKDKGADMAKRRKEFLEQFKRHVPFCDTTAGGVLDAHPAMEIAACRKLDIDFFRPEICHNSGFK